MKKFDEVIIIDWFDNIIKAFCKTTNNIFYCSLIAIDFESDEKVYICVSLDYFKNNKKIIEIINLGNFKENWDNFYEFLNETYLKNEYFLIKTKDLKSNIFEIIKYKENFIWPDRILFDDYPEILDKAKIIDNWWTFW